MNGKKCRKQKWITMRTQNRNERDQTLIKTKKMRNEKGKNCLKNTFYGFHCYCLWIYSTGQCHLHHHHHHQPLLLLLWLLLKLELELELKLIIIQYIPLSILVYLDLNYNIYVCATATEHLTRKFLPKYPVGIAKTLHRTPSTN